MKIVQVLTRGDVQGGAQSHVRDLSLALQSRGHDVTVLTGRAGIFSETLHHAGIRTQQISSLVRPVRPHQDLRALLELCDQLRKLRPDVVCAHTAKAGWLARAAARALGIPSVFTPHGWSMVDRASLKPLRGYCWAERLAGYIGTRTINVCEFERTLARSHGVGRAGSLDVVHNGIPDIPLPRTRGVEEQPPTVVMVARFEGQKDHCTLLHALAGLKDLEWKLTLVGEGEREKEVRRLIAGLGLDSRSRLLPGSTDVGRLLLDAQAFVLSTNFEALPISILEAMRAGLPVLSTDVGGVGEAVADGETGMLVPRRDPGALGNALRRMISNPELRGAFGAAGRQRYLAHFTSEAMVAKTLSVYERALLSTATKTAAVNERCLPYESQ